MSAAAGVDLAREVDVRRTDAVSSVDIRPAICLAETSDVHDFRKVAVQKRTFGFAIRILALHRQDAEDSTAVGKIRKAPAFLPFFGVEPPPLPLNLARCCNLKIVDVKILFRDESPDERALFLLVRGGLHCAAVEKGNEKDRREDRSKNQYRFRFTLHALPPILRRIAECRPHCTRARSRCG